MDAPLHFNPKGAAVKDLPIEEFLYENPLLVDIPKGAGEKIYTEDLRPYEQEIKGRDLLMIRRGFPGCAQKIPRCMPRMGRRFAAMRQNI